MIYNEEIKLISTRKGFLSEKSDVQIYDGLVIAIGIPGMKERLIMFFKENKEGATGIDILKGESFDSPQKNHLEEMRI
jgi:hypothetical protein